MRNHPHLYEIHVSPFLRRISGRFRKPLTLGTVPPSVWEDLARKGFDLVWLMGLWRKSPGARERALGIPGLRKSYGRALPDWEEADIQGSPFAVHSYHLDPALGDPRELETLKRKLNDCGLGLIVDFVPNHLALDHPWVKAHPERFVRALPEALEAHPEWFFSPIPGVSIAHGRDPYFPPWSDTAQIDLLSREAQGALIRQLLSLADAADGVRCDMAMLALRRVFEGVWNGVRKPGGESGEEFWREAIRRVKARRPDFLLIAEVYWGLEMEMLELGFDFAYDKPLYDLLRSGDPPAIRRHLAHRRESLGRGVHFIENHDEERAAAAFGGERSRCAAAVVATLPGLRFFHDGQLEGRRIRLPVQLLREPREPPDETTGAFFTRLLSLCDSPVFHQGAWEPLDRVAAGKPATDSGNILSWSWRDGDDLRMVVLNYSGQRVSARIRADLPPTLTEPLRFQDDLTGRIFTCSGREYGERGLELGLNPWDITLLRLS